MVADAEAEFMKIQDVAKTDQIKRNPSKASKRNLKKKAVRKAKCALKVSKSSKPSLPRLPSFIVIPQSPCEQALDGEALLAEIKRRTIDKNSRSVRIMPIPKKCPPLLLQDLCPTSIAVRIPAKENCRYAFIEFKTVSEARAMANELNGKILDGRHIRAFVCEERPTSNNWKSLQDRTLDDFDLNNLFVSNLPRFAERTDLAQIFRTADKINLENLPDGTCKGCCILKYRDRNSALEAFTSRHGTLYRGTPIFVNFQFKSKTKDTTEQDAKSAAEIAGKASRKRKASKNDDEQEAPVKVSMPKNNCRSKSAEFVNESGEGKKNMPAVKTNQEVKKGMKADLTKDSEFSLRAKSESGSRKAKLQPYQLARKKELKKSKTKLTKK
ncbi:hypothetical protein Aperf_G00000007026 [Anoplocephala perfoliata]